MRHPTTHGGGHLLAGGGGCLSTARTPFPAPASARQAHARITMLVGGVFATEVAHAQPRGNLNVIKEGDQQA
jgi:hypothetical protein